MAAAPPTPDLVKWQAYMLVKQDDVASLERLLSPIDPENWRRWRNFAGATLYQVAETEAKRSAKESHCLRFLRRHLEGLGLEQVQVPKSTYHDVVMDVPVEAEQDLVVSVPDIHHHKILRYVPDITVTEVSELLEVPQITVKEELKVVEKIVESEKEIPHTHVKVVEQFVPIKGRLAPETVEEEFLIHLPPLDNVLERPDVEVRENIRTIPGQMRTLEEQEVVEVPMEVLVPKTVIKEVHIAKKRPREVVVPCIAEMPVIVDKLEEVVKTIEVPETTIIQKIRYVPKWDAEVRQSKFEELGEPGGVGGGCGAGAVARGATAQQRLRSDLREEIDELRRANESLTRERSSMEEDLASCARSLERLKEELQEERRERDAARSRLSAARLDADMSELKATSALRTPSTGLGGAAAASAHAHSGHSLISWRQSPDMESFFDRADTNHDGVISRSEFDAALPWIERRLRRPW